MEKRWIKAANPDKKIQKKLLLIFLYPFSQFFFFETCPLLNIAGCCINNVYFYERRV